MSGIIITEYDILSEDESCTKYLDPRITETQEKDNKIYFF